MVDDYMGTCEDSYDCRYKNNGKKGHTVEKKQIFQWSIQIIRITYTRIYARLDLGGEGRDFPPGV